MITTWSTILPNSSASPLQNAFPSDNIILKVSPELLRESNAHKEQNGQGICTQRTGMLLLLNCKVITLDIN